MTGHQSSKTTGNIKANIIKTAKEFNLDYNASNASVQIMHNGNTLEMFFKQGLCSLNNGCKAKIYNFRACIISKLNLKLQH